MRNVFRVTEKEAERKKKHNHTEDTCTVRALANVKVHI